MDLITKNVARTLINTIGTGRIVKMTTSIVSGAVEAKKDIPLIDDETEIIGILYEVDGIGCFSTCAIRENADGKTEITRQISVKPLTEIIENLLSNI